ncbi:MAG: cache domain-containing protein, partial [Thermomicrobiales bacterium]
RKPFAYAEYPFDEQDLWIRLWPRDFIRNVVLVPDFASYFSMDPGTLPGMEKEFVYSGWNPVYAGFSLSPQPYSSSFGIGNAGEYPFIPELYFNLILNRKFAGPFFEHLIFSIAVALLLFGLLILTTNDDDLKARFQLSTAGVFGAASGLLFAVILKHNQLRTQIGSSGVAYIEVIPILFYGAIVAVVLNAIVLASPYPARIHRQRGNFVPVLLYWPVLLGVLYGVTLFVFFRR